MRALAPNGLRVAVAHARRAGRDYGSSGSRPRFAARQRSSSNDGFGHCVVQIDQQIVPNAFLSGKLTNISLGAARLDGVVVAPGETLSFWKLVGRPSTAAGFQLGRSIRGGLVGGEVGGGLCQVSGIAYEAGLRAGMVAVERHAHSCDLYTEEDRFTPLGLDATLVWPNKDLRLSNPFAFPLRFNFAVRELGVSASIHAPIPMAAAALEIDRIDHETRSQVRVVRRNGSDEAETISDDCYPRLQ